MLYWTYVKVITIKVGDLFKCRSPYRLGNLYFKYLLEKLVEHFFCFYGITALLLDDLGGHPDTDLVGTEFNSTAITQPIRKTEEPPEPTVDVRNTCGFTSILHTLSWCCALIQKQLFSNFGENDNFGISNIFLFIVLYLWRYQVGPLQIRLNTVLYNVDKCLGSRVRIDYWKCYFVYFNICGPNMHALWVAIFYGYSTGFEVKTFSLRGCLARSYFKIVPSVSSPIKKNRTLLTEKFQKVLCFITIRNCLHPPSHLLQRTWRGN
jgi:hypothetical protein